MTINERGPSGSANEATAQINNDSAPIKAGMITDFKNVYQSKPDKHNKTSWVDKYPDDLEEAAENAETARFALIIRNQKCYDGRKSLKVHSIVVQSPLLKASLGTVLKDYPGITTSLERLTFNAPFQPFIHRWANLKQALEEETDAESKSHLELLHRVLEDELREDLKARDDYILNGVITWDTCWMIFEPGTVVFAIADGQPCAAKLNSAAYCETPCDGKHYLLTCNIVDWDGEKFGYGTIRYKIREFLGTMKITQLTAFPLENHPSASEVKEELIQKGKAFEALSGYHYSFYRGIGIGFNTWSEPVKYNVESRTIIDTYGWNRFNPSRQVSLGPLGTKGPVTPESDQETDYGDDEYNSECDSESESAAGLVNGHGNENKIKAAPLTTDQLLLCSATLKGYSLKNKKWLILSVHSVHPIQWSTNAFTNLVLPSDHKELILALTESQALNKETFDDVIAGKGKGMILLLSGPPGVGKTLTAESVAETMKAPLYMMSAADLGLTSADVETSLSNVLEMATKWNAILLLDEADVFLEQRSANDLERNKLVSIFLRILEYYEGILFLTTNRVDNIDAAFQSRIHISMQYEELTLSSRKIVWRNFLDKSAAGDGSGRGEKGGFSEEDLEKLAGYRMNGREIKNVLKIAQLLACRKGEGLGIGHVLSVLAVEQRRVGVGS